MSQGPSQPWAPKISMNISPATTGDTAKGRSMRVPSSRRPGNWNLPSSQPAARPKLVLRVTAARVAVRLSRRAAQASGSRRAAR